MFAVFIASSVVQQFNRLIKRLTSYHCWCYFFHMCDSHFISLFFSPCPWHSMSVISPRIPFSHLFFSLYPCVTPFPNSSKQNGARRSSPVDQNTLFSEFSPFTLGEREATLRPPSPAETRTQHLPD